jgi:hypothetical protein
MSDFYKWIIVGAIIMELHSSWKLVVLAKLQLSYNELQCINIINCKANCKTPFFHSVWKMEPIFKQVHWPSLIKAC